MGCASRKPAPESIFKVMRLLRSQRLVSARLAAVWLALLAITAALAAYGATYAHASWEVETVRSVQAASPSPMRAVAEFMTAIGRSPASLLIPATAIVALWISGKRWLSAFLVLAALTRVLSPMVKALVDRPRPSDSLVNVVHHLGDPSFPSGHVLGATLLYGFLIYCAEVCIPARGIRRSIQAVLVLAIALMGYARVQLGAHWPTDVVGGYALGLLVLTTVIWLHSRVDENGSRERLHSVPAHS